MFDNGAPIEDFHISLILLEGGIWTQMSSVLKMCSKRLRKKISLFSFYFHILFYFWQRLFFADNPCFVVLPNK